ncbi:hypothetical protein Purlil1_850 [Purpureocillium lilacinum]|uniref:Uncharacterized protein n=1 Tax=Purpureocillium lilacinum TaxID=33203 RepID=A0ABR0CG86_PURLI|nr:hypothetical protein Purlil1_850 [Purpureocillium lilacinum]
MAGFPCGLLDDTVDTGSGAAQRLPGGSCLRKEGFGNFGGTRARRTKGRKRETAKTDGRADGRVVDGIKGGRRKAEHIHQRERPGRRVTTHTSSSAAQRSWSESESTAHAAWMVVSVRGGGERRAPWTGSNGRRRAGRLGWRGHAVAGFCFAASAGVRPRMGGPGGERRPSGPPLGTWRAGSVSSLHWQQPAQPSPPVLLSSMVGACESQSGRRGAWLAGRLVGALRRMRMGNVPGRLGLFWHDASSATRIRPAMDEVGSIRASMHLFGAAARAAAAAAGWLVWRELSAAAPGISLLLPSPIWQGE